MKRMLGRNRIEGAAVVRRSHAPRRHGVAGTVDTLETEDTAETPFEEGAHDSLDPDLRHRMISEAAYHLYEQRGYVDGYDLDDWLQAEAEVDHVSLHSDREPNTDAPLVKSRRVRPATS